jgi:hypothetical protein
MSVEALDGGVLRHPGVRSKSCLSLYGLARPATARAASPETDPQATRGQALLLTDGGPSAIITTTPNEVACRWLTAATPPADLLQPYPGDEMEAYPVSKAVSSPVKDEAAPIQRIEAP